jgi:hypothetical protein
MHLPHPIADIRVLVRVISSTLQFQNAIGPEQIRFSGNDTGEEEPGAMLSVQEQGALSGCSKAGGSGNLLQPHHTPHPAIPDPDRKIEGYMPGNDAFCLKQTFKPDCSLVQPFGNSEQDIRLFPSI